MTGQHPILQIMNVGRRVGDPERSRRAEATVTLMISENRHFFVFWQFLTLKSDCPNLFGLYSDCLKPTISTG